MLLHSNQKLRALLKGQFISIALFVRLQYRVRRPLARHRQCGACWRTDHWIDSGRRLPYRLDRHDDAGKCAWRLARWSMLLAFAGAGAFARQRNQAYIEIDQAADAHQRGDANAALARCPTRHPAQAGRCARSVHAWNPAAGCSSLCRSSRSVHQHPLRLRPKFGPAYVNLCVAQRELKLLPEALANCEKGAQCLPTTQNRGLNLGRVRYRVA